MPEALVGLGSNLAPDRHLPAAVRLLAERLEVRALSSAWATPPVGPAGQPPFLNAAALVTTELAPHALKAGVLREVERRLGRVRTRDRFAPRQIDLDLVLYLAGGADPGDETRRVRELVLDPDLHHEVHLAVPAAELLPDWVHPATGEALARLAERLVAALPPADRPRRTGLALVT
jgi:2-amino-4-hydroxy-6-hydroxymethyldihydropteridine diphosphokinase